MQIRTLANVRISVLMILSKKHLPDLNIQNKSFMAADLDECREVTVVKCAPGIVDQNN